MSNWVVSVEALKKLAALLAKEGVNCERLSRDLALEPERGEGSESLFECMYKLARSASGFRADHLEVIEAWFEGAQKEFFRNLAVELDLAEPANPLLTAAELQELGRVTERASLFDERRLKAVRQKLNVKFIHYAASSEEPRKQWQLWFRACARQSLQDAAQPWLPHLAQCAADACEDAAARRPFDQVRDRCQSGAAPWHLVELLKAPAPSPSSGVALRRDGAAAPDRDAPAALPAGPPKSGYALVIGISEYADPGMPPLKCAAKDAQQVAEHLRTQPDIDFSDDRVSVLTDRSATLRDILGGLDRLRSQCMCSTDPDPLAVVYFSGHGMPDLAGRHFLVPHDGDPQQLFATALWNRTFNAALEQIQTRRLVVLLDACHAQGIVAPAGVKDGAAFSYDPDDEQEGLHLEPGRGRYFIASCAAGQRSFEGEEYGIFTQALLALLRFEEVEAEQLDLADLYRHLRRRVDQEARRRFDGRSQTPTANIPDAIGATGLILAINQRRADRLRLFLEAVRKHVQDNRFPQKSTIVVRLVNFVERNERPTPDDPEFFDLFTEGAERWQGPEDEACVREVCSYLASRLGAARAASAARGVAPPGRTSSDFASAQAPGSLRPAGATAPVSSAPATSSAPMPAPGTVPGAGATAPAYQWRTLRTDR